MAKGFPGRLKRKSKDRFPKKMKQLVLGEGWEPLTDELIDELVVKNGMPKKDLLYAKKTGAFYCRPRNSIIWPPEFGPI